MSDVMKVQRDMDRLTAHIEKSFDEYLVEMIRNNRIPEMLLKHNETIYNALARLVSFYHFSLSPSLTLIFSLCFALTCSSRQ